MHFRCGKCWQTILKIYMDIKWNNTSPSRCGHKLKYHSTTWKGFETWTLPCYDVNNIMCFTNHGLEKLARQPTQIRHNWDMVGSRRRSSTCVGLTQGISSPNSVVGARSSTRIRRGNEILSVLRREREGRGGRPGRRAILRECNLLLLCSCEAGSSSPYLANLIIGIPFRSLDSVAWCYV